MPRAPVQLCVHGSVLACALGLLLAAHSGPARADASYEEAYERYALALEQRDLETAAVYARKALTLATEALGPDHQETGILALNLGKVYLKLDRPRDAAKALTQAVRVYGAVHGERAMACLEPSQRLAEALAALERWRESERYYVQALGIAEKHLGREHRRTAKILVQLVDVASALEAHSRVRNYGLRAIAIVEKERGPQSLPVGSLHLKLAQSALAEGDARNAHKHMEVAIAIYEQSLEPGNQRLDALYEFVSKGYEISGKPRSARKYKRKLEENRDAASGGSGG